MARLLRRLGLFTYRKGRGWWGIRHTSGVSLGWDYRESLMVGVRWDFPMDGLVFFALGFRLVLTYEMMWRYFNGLLGVRVRETREVLPKE